MRALLLLIPTLLLGDVRETPLPIGNFSVSLVSQIAPLISFGQLLTGENSLLPQISGSYARGYNSYSNLIAPNLIYGIRDDFSVFFYLPLFPRNKLDSFHSSGLGDLLLQFEYGYYNRTRKTYTLEATVVANVQFPTGSSSKVPPTGAGWFSYFLGTTFAYTSFNWYAFVSPGVNIPTGHRGTKFGNSYLYQWGFARYIKQLSPPGCIFDLMLEFDGIYTQKNKIHGHIVPKLDQNQLFITPSLWLSSNQWVIQWGMSFPLFHDHFIYSIDYNLGISIQF